ncbi:unnamed protein product, partial [Rotaria magnacalcarata]
MTSTNGKSGSLEETAEA